LAKACLEDINFDKKREIDKTLIAKLATGEWIRKHQQLILTGATGTGKSWLEGDHQQHILDILDDRYQKKSTLVNYQYLSGMNKLLIALLLML